VVKAGAFEAIERPGKVKKIVASGHAENPEGAGDPESFVERRLYTAAIIHKKQVGVKLYGQCNGRTLCGAEFCQRVIN